MKWTLNAKVIGGILVGNAFLIGLNELADVSKVHAVISGALLGLGCLIFFAEKES